MAASNALVADLLRRYASLLRLEGADRFKIGAYQRGADMLDSSPEDVGKLVAAKQDLTKLPGIGKALAGVIEEIVRTGTFRRFDQSHSALTPELAEIAALPGLDVKKVQKIYKKLDIRSVTELRRRLESGDIREQFGARMDFHVRHGLDQRPRMLLWSAEKWTGNLQTFLKSLPGVKRVAPIGSLRRKQDTVGDLGFLVSGGTAAAIFKRFAQFGGVQLAERHGKAEQSFRLSSGQRITLRWTPDRAWGLALMLATGSAAHVTRLRSLAKRKKILLELPASAAKHTDIVDEAVLYRRLGLQFIEPELRENRGEIEAAAKNALPKLITVQDLVGDLHMHTTASDGVNSIVEMAEAARERGYRYIAITDHSQSLKLTNGLSEKRLLSQVRRIDKLNARWNDFVVLKSSEVDILEDGKLDYSQAVLKELDLTICSIHSRFALDGRQQTERIMRAMDNRYFNILGHATGRLLLKREGYEIDAERILRHARENGCFAEINSSPDRLDLSDENALTAKRLGVKIAVNTDAHAIRELNFITAGINQARRGWLKAGDVLNACELPALRKLLKR